MRTGSEEWQKAFSQASLGNSCPLQSLIDAEIVWVDLYPLISIPDHPAVETTPDLGSLFVLKNEIVHSTFGLIAPEDAATLCFAMACHQKGTVHVTSMLAGLPSDPEFHAQIATLPDSWCKAMPACMETLLAENIETALEELIASKLKGGDFFFRIPLALGKPAEIRDALRRGLCATDSALNCLRAAWGPWNGDSHQVSQGGIVYSLNHRVFESPICTFLEVCRTGVLSPDLLTGLHRAGLNLQHMPYPIESLDEVEGYLAVESYHGAKEDHRAWIERTHLNGLGYFFVQGDNQAFVPHQHSKINATLKSAVISAWVGYKASALAFLNPTHLDNNLGVDLGCEELLS